MDTGPLIALFDPADAMHATCKHVLQGIMEPICTTVPVLTEAFHMLSPESVGADRLRDFIRKGGMTIWDLDTDAVTRAFELMEQYADHPMDLADASLIVAAEFLTTRKIFTIDRNDFESYRIKRGYRHFAVEIISASY